MSDNNLDIRARLTADDKLSPTVVRLLAKIKSLEDQMAKFGKKARASIAEIPMEKYVKSLNGAGKELNGLTQKHLRWAKANNVTNKDALIHWGLLTNKIKDLSKEHEKYANSSAKGAKTRARDIEKELKLHYKNAQAFKYLYNKTAEDRVNLQRRTNQEISNLEAAHLRNEQLRQRRHYTNISRMRREAMGGLHTMANIGSRAGPYAAASAAATGYAGVSAFRTRMKTDTAETNLRMFGEMSQAEVRQWRKDYGNRSAIKYGMGPAEMIDSLTEVRKAGVGKDKAQAVTDTILKSGAGLDLDLKETTRFATRLATLTQDMSNLDPEKLKKMLNSVAIANIATAADANEIIAANRRASGVFSSSKMDPNDISAFTGAGISAGLPSAKTGTFLGFMVNEMVGAKFARGQRASDLSKASNLLGMGGRQSLSHKMASDPTNTLMSIFDKMGNMSEEKQSQVATLLGMREWRDELQTFVQVRDDVRRTLKEIHDNKNASKLDEISEAKLKSLAGRWRSLVSALTLTWEAVGAGLEKAFGEISSFFTDYLAVIDTEKISAIVEGFTDGLVQGLGFDNWTAALKYAFGDPKDFDGKGWADKVRLFTKGFVSEMVKMWKVVSGMFTAAAAAFDGTDPEAMGRFTGHLLELAVALKSIGALAETMVTVIHFFEGLAAILAVLKASPVLQFIAKYAGGPGSVAAVGGMTTNQEDDELSNGAAKWKELRSKYGQDTIDAARKKYQPWYQFGNGYASENEQWIKQYQEDQKKDPNFKKSSYTGSTDFSGRRRTSDLADSLNKFTGKVERAAFINSVPGGLQNAALGGSGLGLSGSGGGGLGGRSFIGGVPELLKTSPGSALPNMGGGIIRRDKIPSFGGGGSGGGLNKSGFDKVFGGTPLAGKYDQIVAAAKANGIEPSLLASVMAQESGGGKFLSGNNPGGIMDPATNWSKKMQFADLDAGISKTASTVAKNYARAGGDMSKLAGIYAPQGAANDPNGLNKNWLSGVQSFQGKLGAGAGGAGGGSAGTGDAVGFGRQYLGLNEYSDTQRLAAYLGADPRGKSNAWCARFVNKSLAAAGGQGTGSAVANSFQKWGSAVDPANVARNDVLLQTHGKGYNQTGGHVGMATGETRMNNGRMQVKMLAGNDGDSVREHWIDVDKNLMVRRGNAGVNVPQGITSQVPPSSMIQNVPPPASRGAGGGGLQTMNGGGGPVQIHINGNSHDPEALATMVQRRIDESMNWRTHDTSSEYT